MELKKRFNFRNAFIVIYFAAFIVYGFVGLRSVDAKNYIITANLHIPSIGLSSDVTTLEVQDGKLNTPDYIVGSFSQSNNKTLLIGHSSTVFHSLSSVKLGDVIEYGSHNYEISELVVMPKEEVSMGTLLATSDEETIILMTCAGDDLGGGDSTHRLIITAIRR